MTVDSLKVQINDTIGVIQENINKVSQRGERLDSLQQKNENLGISAKSFRRGANRVRKEQWWKDMKMRMCLIGGIIILLIVITVLAGMPESRLCKYKANIRLVVTHH